MKKVVLGLALMVSGFSFAQQLTYEQVSTAKERIRGDFTEYVAKDGSVYKIGDKIRIGVPSSNKTFAFIYQGDGLLLPVTPLSITASGTETEIKNILIGGTKRAGFQVFLKSKSAMGIPSPGYSINFENAVSAGEIKSFGMTSDEALTEMKKLKDKLDLDLITKEVYEAKKLELVKFIK